MMQEDLVQQAIALARKGQKTEARALLQQVLHDNPRNETAWLWYADCAPTPEERMRALETCLQVIPDARLARIGLEKLRREMPAWGVPPSEQDQEAVTQQSAPRPPELMRQQSEAETQEQKTIYPEKKPPDVPPTQPEHRLPVNQFPVPGSPPAPSTGRTQPVRVEKHEAKPHFETPELPEESEPEHPAVPEHAIPEILEPAASDERLPEAESGTEFDMASLRASLAAKEDEKPHSPVKIFEQQPPRPAEPNPFTVTPGEYPHAAPHTPVIKPLKAQIERRLERDLGLDVPLPPEPTQRIRVRPKENQASRGMILLYIAIAMIGVLGAAAVLIGLILSGR